MSSDIEREDSLCLGRCSLGQCLLIGVVVFHLGFIVLTMPHSNALEEWFGWAQALLLFETSAVVVWYTIETNLIRKSSEETGRLMESHTELLTQQIATLQAQVEATVELYRASNEALKEARLSRSISYLPAFHHQVYAPKAQTTEGFKLVFINYGNTALNTRVDVEGSKFDAPLTGSLIFNAPLKVNLEADFFHTDPVYVTIHYQTLDNQLGHFKYHLTCRNGELRQVHPPLDEALSELEHPAVQPAVTYG